MVLVKMLVLALVLHSLICASNTVGETTRRYDGNSIPCTGTTLRDCTLNYTKNQPLFLTPYIECNKTSLGVARSQVTLFNRNFGTTAFAGYITVEKYCFSNLFFLLVRAKKNHRSGPLILWLQGAELSSLLGQFLENGPVRIDIDGNFSRRHHALTDDFNVLYLDQPAGTGYSFTKHTDCYSRSLAHMVRDIRVFLRQFLTLFPEYDGRDFYVAGKSYGVRPAIGLAYDLHNDVIRRIPRKRALKLRGVICGAGLFGPLLPQTDLSDYLRQLGLLDYNGYRYAQQVVKRSASIIQNAKKMEDYEPAFWRQLDYLYLIDDLVGANISRNILQSLEPHEYSVFYEMAEKDEFKNYFHAGTNATMVENNSTLYLAFDNFYDMSNLTRRVLNAGYKFLVYLGQLDPVISSASTEVFLRNFKWKGSEAFKNAKRHHWYVHPHDRSLSGYFRKALNLTYVLVRRAGHYPGFDQEEAVYHLIRGFVKDEEFTLRDNSDKITNLLSRANLSSLNDENIENSAAFLQTQLSLLASGTL